MNMRKQKRHDPHDPIFEIGSLVQKRIKFALATVIKASGSTPRKEGSRMIVFADGSTRGSVGGGIAERMAYQKAMESLQDGTFKRFEADLDDPRHESTGSVCGGRIEVFIEPFGPQTRLWLFGAGHVAKPVAKLARDVGFQVTVIDTRSELASAKRFPEAELIVGSGGEEAEKIESAADDFIAVMTPSHDEDYEIVKKVLKKEYAYLGVIGSKKKAIHIRKSLKEDGFADTDIERMTCPVGIEIGSHTPDEIAVSVVGQMIQVRNLKGK